MTDADTILDKNFVYLVEENFEKDTTLSVAAVGGYVTSIKHNWITACKPGCATAIRTSVIKELSFNHDTVTEDLDFTFQIHLK